MASKQRYVLARKFLAGSLVLCLHGCGSLDTGSPRSPLGWGPNGAPARTSPAEDADVRIALARVAESQGDINGAEAAYREALKRDKKRGDAHLHLANIHTLKGDYRSAADAYQKALEISPGNPDVFCDMGYSLYLQGRPQDAERNLKQAIAIDPRHKRSHNNLALVLAHSNRAEEALAEFRKSDCSLVDARLNLAFSMTVDRRWAEAREQYRLVLAAQPSSAVAATRLRQLDHLIASTDVGGNGKPGTRDAKVVTASASTSAIDGAAAPGMPPAQRPGNARMPAPRPTTQQAQKSVQIPPPRPLALPATGAKDRASAARTGQADQGVQGRGTP